MLLLQGILLRAAGICILKVSLYFKSWCFFFLIQTRKYILFFVLKVIFPDFLLLFKRTAIPPENRLVSTYKNIALKCVPFHDFHNFNFSGSF